MSPTPSATPNIPPTDLRWMNWPLLRTAVAFLAGVFAVLTPIRKIFGDRKDRQSKARQKEIADAIKPELDILTNDIRERHDENRSTLQTIQLEQAEMKVKVNDLWDRRQRQREGS